MVVKFLTAHKHGFAEMRLADNAYPLRNVLPIQATAMLIPAAGIFQPGWPGKNAYLTVRQLVCAYVVTETFGLKGDNGDLWLA
jgi:hypothetical protein